MARGAHECETKQKIFQTEFRLMATKWTMPMSMLLGAQMAPLMIARKNE